MAGHSDELNRIHKSFDEAIERLPDSGEGLLNLISVTFGEVISLGMATPDSVSNPVTWADIHVHGWIGDLFIMHEFGLSLEEEFRSEIQHLRTELVGQASIALYGSRRPLLEEIYSAGPHNPIIRGLIRRDFGPLVNDVTKARIAVLVKKTESKETVPGRFMELASLDEYEVKRLLRPALRPERKIGVSHRIAAELVGGRCALEVGTVLHYAQPGRPKAKREKKI